MVSENVGTMKYKVIPANNLRSLYPQLPKESIVESDRPLTVSEIAIKVGIPTLMVVAGQIDNKLYQLDEIVGKDSEVVIYGPVAGG